MYKLFSPKMTARGSPLNYKQLIIKRWLQSWVPIYFFWTQSAVSELKKVLSKTVLCRLKYVSVWTMNKKQTQVSINCIYSMDSLFSKHEIQKCREHKMLWTSKNVIAQNNHFKTKFWTNGTYTFFQDSLSVEINWTNQNHKMSMIWTHSLLKLNPRQI